MGLLFHMEFAEQRVVGNGPEQPVNVEIGSDQQRFRPAVSEVGRLWADNQKAKRLLGWEPRFGV